MDRMASAKVLLCFLWLTLSPVDQSIIDCGILLDAIMAIKI